MFTDSDGDAYFARVSASSTYSVTTNATGYITNTTATITSGTDPSTKSLIVWMVPDYTRNATWEGSIINLMSKFYVPSAHVDLLQNSLWKNVSTTSTGNFSINNLEIGKECTVYIWKDGYIPHDTITWTPLSATVYESYDIPL
jgi:hypothetical protein